MKLKDLATISDEEFREMIRTDLTPQEALQLLSDIQQHFSGLDQASILFRRIAIISRSILVASMSAVDHVLEETIKGKYGLKV
jgi:hypothetical protein